MLMRWDNTKKTEKLSDIKGFNLTNKPNISYANVSSVAKPEKSSRE